MSRRRPRRSSTRRHSRRSMRRCAGATCCPRSSSWTPATATRRRSSPPTRTMPSPCAGRHGPTTSGRRAQNGFALTACHLDWEGERAICPARPRPHLGAVLEHRLRAVPESAHLLPRHGPVAPSYAVLPPARAVRGLAHRPPTRDDRGVRRDVCPPRRDRGHACPRPPPLPPAPHTLSGPAAGPTRPSPRRDRPQLPPPRRVVRGQRLSTATTLALRPPPGRTTSRLSTGASP
jgi:hypothetical protein